MCTKIQNCAGFNWTKPNTWQSKHSRPWRGSLSQTLFIILSTCAASLPISSTAQVQSLVAGNTAFALNVYAQLATNSGNIFFSPYSISTCMAMIYAGARGNTQAQMSQVFGFGTNQQQFASTFGQLQESLQSDQQTNAIELNMANALWTQLGFPFLPDFLQTATNQYQANVNQADFVTDPDAVRQTINNWVAQETQNKIIDILPPKSINAATRLVLANAIYFKGAWTYTFDETNTSIQPFYVSSTSQVQVPLMHQPFVEALDEISPSFRYKQNPDFQALELPYGSNQISMLLLLPTRIDGLGELEQKLTPSFLSNVLAQMLLQQVEIFLPRFTNEPSFNLSSTLSQMGMPDAFTSGVADFSGLDEMHDLFLSFVVHKAWVEVEETGTEAAAATVGGVGALGWSPPPLFRADHPFVFFIRDTQTGSVLFMGRVTNPSQSDPVPVPLPKLALTRTSVFLNVSWPYPSTPWTLQQSTDLRGTNWTTVAARGALVAGPPFTGIYNDGINNVVPMFAPVGNLFFRLIRQ